MLPCIIIFGIVSCSVATISPPPNFVIIVTDDQDIFLNGMVPMKKTMEHLGTEGVIVENAFTTSPMCCPSRASLLTGMYAHNHATVNNSASGGCYGRFWQESIEPVHTLPILLQSQGYTTFYAGKYLNEYHASTVPPGWDKWYGLHGNSKYYNYTLTKNGEVKKYSDTYLTDLLQNVTVNFIKQQPPQDEPFLAIIAPPAPHAPFEPAARHIDKFKGTTAPRTPNFNIPNSVLEKHWLLRMLPQLLSTKTIENIDRIYHKRWETLLAVDELVDSTVEALREMKMLDNTYIIFTSDNGYHMGQFGQAYDKRQPYESDIRVPLLIRGPNIPKNQKLRYPVGLHDLTPTILDLAGLRTPVFMDGESVKDQLEMANSKDSKKFDRMILVEHWGEGEQKIPDDSECEWSDDISLYGCTKDADCRCQDSQNNTFACIRHISNEHNKIYCEFDDEEGFVEAYDLNADLFQLENQGYKWLPSVRGHYSLLLNQLKQCIGGECKINYLSQN